MKILLLLRHAKSSWKHPDLADFDRPLNKRGRKAAARMGVFLAAEGLQPDRVLCSAARRAQDTWQLAGGVLGSEVPTKTYRSLYLAGPARLLEVVRRQPAELDRLLLVGHNPGMASLICRLAGPTSDAQALARVTEKYPTAALAELQFAGENWSELALGSARLRRCVIPSDLD